MRPTCPALDARLGVPVPVLDHGEVVLVDYMGDDAAIVQAARVSYGDGTKSVREDAALIDFLMRGGHTSPFEMCEIKLRVKLPIFVARQWVRHRTASINEVSARYSELPAEAHVPEVGQIRAQSTANRQGRDEPVDAEEAQLVRDFIARLNEAQHESYWILLGKPPSGEDAGPAIARELARVVLPLSTYTSWYWKTDLHNLFHFLALRLDSHAQYEIRVYAEVIWDIVQEWVPMAATAFRKHRLSGARLSGPALAAVREGLTSGLSRPVGLSDREWRELCDLMGVAK